MTDGEDPSRSHIIPVEHPERLMARLRGWDPVEDPFGSGVLRSFEQDMFSFFEPFTPPFTDTGYIRPQMLDMALFGYNPFTSGLRTDQENRVHENVSRQPQALSEPQAQANAVSLISESGITEYKARKHPFTDDHRHSFSTDSTWDKANVTDYDTGRDGDVDTEFDISSLKKTKAKRLPVNSQKVREDDVIHEDIHDTDSGFFREETKDNLRNDTTELNAKQVEETQPEISRNIDIQSGQQNAYISRVDTSDYDQTLIHGDVFGGVPGRFTNPLDLRSLQANTYEVLNTTMEFRVNMDVLHFKPEEIEIQVEDNRITIHGRHAERQDDHGLIEREFTRIYRVPADADSTRVTSCLYANGVLTVRAPKLNAPDTGV